MIEVLGLGIPEAFPTWLSEWLEIDFYGEKCSKHTCKYLTIFCAVCMGKPCCELCWKTESKHHKDHRILQVCQSSRRAAIVTHDIKSSFDISDIQPYIINRKNIVYLKPENSRVNNDQNHLPTCNHCYKKLKESKYSFCSIACKKHIIEKSTQNLESNSCNIETTVQQVMPSTMDKRDRGECSSSSMKISFRPPKRARKGIPMRSPLK